MSSSGVWEVVSKKKDRANGKSYKLTKAEKKKFIENAPKVEDFCESSFHHNLLLAASRDLP